MGALPVRRPGRRSGHRGHAAGLAAFTSPSGQVVAAGLLAAYVGLLIALRTMSATPAPPRLLGKKARREVAA